MIPRRSSGRRGLEKVWEEELCGRPGAKSVLVDVFGWPIEERLKKRPVDGRTLELGLDLTMQTILERAIEGRPGAVVALDPATGDVLALASYPDYDPNLFTRALTRRQWAHLADPGRAILLNRACEAAYQPGSTFKIVTAMAALHAGVLAPGDVRTCTGSFQIGKRVAHCWVRWGHGSVDLVRALAKSCNVFFYGLGGRARGGAALRHGPSAGARGRLRPGPARRDGGRPARSELAGCVRPEGSVLGRGPRGTT